MDNIHIESTSDLVALALFGDYQRIESEHISVAHNTDQCYLKVKYRVTFSNESYRCFALKFNLDPVTHKPLEPLDVLEE